MYVLVVAFSDLLEQTVFGLGSEGIVALQHDIHEDAHRPHICVHGDVITLTYDFWGHVSGGAAERVYSLGRASCINERVTN